MRNRRLLDIGGIVAGVCLISFGFGLIVSALDDRSHDSLRIPSRSVLASLDYRPDAIASLRAAVLENLRPPNCAVAAYRVAGWSDCFDEAPRFRTVDVEGETVTVQLPPLTRHDTAGSAAKVVFAPTPVVRAVKRNPGGPSRLGLFLGIALVPAGLALVVAGAVDGRRQSHSFE